MQLRASSGVHHEGCPPFRDESGGRSDATGQNGAKNVQLRRRLTSKDEETHPGNVPLKDREKCRMILPQFDLTLDRPVDAVFKAASIIWHIYYYYLIYEATKPLSKTKPAVISGG